MEAGGETIFRMGLVISICLLCSGGVAQTQAPFVNDSDNINVLGRWSSGDDPSNGAVTDYNGDGYKDLFVPFRTPGRLGAVLSGYSINEYTHSPIFNPQQDNIFDGTGFAAESVGVLFADFNNDGYSDFYAPNINGHHLYKYNPATQKYDDITSTISTPGGFSSTISGSWGDFNGDGWIDLLLLKYGGSTLTGQTYSHEQKLLVNNGGQGFSLQGVAETGINAYIPGIVSALWCDFSGDGYVDLALIEGGYFPGGASKYFKNVYNHGVQGRYMALVETPAMVANYPELSWDGNTAVSMDANNDGALDVAFHSDNALGALLTDTSDPDDYLPFAINASGGTYGSNTPTCWNIGALDYNLDGNMDFLGVRYTNKETAVFVNRPDLPVPFYYGQWVEAFPRSTASSHLDDVGMCLADFSQDGYTDVFLSRSQGGVGNNDFYFTGRPADFNYRDWIGIELFAPGDDPSAGWFCNYDCIGATVTIHAGNHIQAQSVDGGSGRARQADRCLIFGLGDYGPDTIDFIDVSLPNGEEMRFHDLEVNENHKIPVNGVGLVAGSMEFVIEQNSDGTQDWVVNWGTDGLTDATKDRVFFNVREGDSIVAGGYNYGRFADLVGMSTVIKSGSEFDHTVRLEGVVCEPNRFITCILWSGSGSYSQSHQFPDKKVIYCLMSN